MRVPGRRSVAIAPPFHLPYTNPHGARPPDHAKRQEQREKTCHRDKAHRRPGRQGLSTLYRWLLSTLALGLHLAHPTRLLWPLLAALEWPASGSVRPRYAALLSVRSRPLAAGRDLSGDPPRSLGAGTVPVHRCRRALVVRLHLSANGLHRDVSVVGKTRRR